MGVGGISYPIAPEVKAALSRFPNLNARLNLSTKERSDLEVVRLLGNTQYAHIDKLLNFINHSVCEAGAIGRHVLGSKDPFQLNQALAELYLYVDLTNSKCDSITAPEGRGGQRTPDIEVRWNGVSVLIEVFSPIDFMGFRLVQRHVSSILKYLDVQHGFEVRIRVRKAGALDFGYPYDIGDESTIRAWLRDFADRVRRWLIEGAPRDLLFDGASSSWRIEGSLIRLDGDQRRREIVTLTDSHSTDTCLFFEGGTVEDTAQCQWGKKLKNKLAKRQCGDPRPDRLRILTVDFSQAFTSWRDFICWPNLADRMAAVVRLLADRIGGALPYDLVVSAQLGFECCFGPMIVLDTARQCEASAFVRAAELDRPCLPREQNEVDWLSLLSAKDT